MIRSTGLLALILLLTLSTGAHAQAITGTTGNGLIYGTASGKLCITGFIAGLGGTVIIPDTINVFGNNLPVECIGNNAFSNCTSLTGVTIPGSVVSIGSYAFFNCTSLAGVTVPGSVTSIGNNAFSNCMSLTGVTIPGGVTSIGSEVFSNCTGLTGVTIPSSIVSIGSYAFFNCTSLTGVTIPGSVTSIGNDAFSNCSGLTSVIMTHGVASIGSEAFYYCTGLTGVTIPDSVTTVGSDAFSNCSSLTGVTIPGSVVSIASRAFYDCTILNSAVFVGNAPSMGSSVFDFAASDFTVDYYNGATGFTSPVWTDTSGDVYHAVNLGNLPTGSLQVTILPAGAASAGAQWQVDGGEWQNSGAIVTGLFLGKHTVHFNTVSGYVAPDSHPVTIAANQTATDTATYVEAGSLQVTISPQEVAIAGAKWQMDGGAWQESGAIVSGIPVGTHTVSFNSVGLYIEPVSRPVTIYASQTTTDSGTYVPRPGSLRVTISPAGALTVGAKWQVDGGTWQNSGVTVSGLTTGTHTVTFSAASGYTAPSIHTVTVSSNQTTTDAGTYVSQPGSLQVTILPAGAVSAGAQWQVDGGAWQNSGATVSSLTTGTHTVVFSAINGYITPDSQAVTIHSNQTATDSGKYVATIPPHGSLRVTISPGGAMSAGARWQVDGGAWQMGGAAVNNLSIGGHTVTFKTAGGFTTPVSRTVTINASQTTVESGVYILQGPGPANGLYLLDFSGLWDISGRYSGEIGKGIGLDFTIAAVPSGKFTGIGTLHSDDGLGNVMNGSINVSGAVKSSGTQTLLSMTVVAASGSGTVVVGGAVHSMTFTGVIKLKGEIDGNKGRLVVIGGSSSANILDIVTGKKSGKSTRWGVAQTPAELTLPDDVTGDCSLTLNLIPNETKTIKYSGTATLETSTKQTLNLTESGSYLSKTNTSAISLKCAGGGMSMVIATSGTDAAIKSAKGKVFGQTVNYKTP